MSLVGFDEALDRVGLHVRDGNLTHLPWSVDAQGKAVNVAWAGRDVGIFVVDWEDTKTVELEAFAKTDVIVCTTVLNQNGAQTSIAVGDSRRLDLTVTDMTMVFVPKHERLQFTTSVSRGIQSVNVIVDVMSLMEARGLPATALPKSLQRTIREQQIAIERIAPHHFDAIARDVAARRAMFPSLATPYYESKTVELVSAMLSELSRVDAFRAGNGAFDPGILDRLDLVKQIIDRASNRILDVDKLARAAAMNRTKLRSAFKQVYGTTLSGYRSALMLQRAERALKESGGSVKQAARYAGYATTSGFIVAYKRQYGVCPGAVLRD